MYERGEDRLKSFIQFDTEQLKALSNTALPDVTDPLTVKLLWLKTGDPKIRSEQHGRIPHHHKFFEIHFYLEGMAKYMVEKKDIFSVDKNKFIIFPPGVIHEKLEGGKGDLRFSLAYEIPQQNEAKMALAEQLTCKKAFVGLIAPDMRDIFMNLAAELDLHSSLTPVILRNYVFNLIYRACIQEEREQRSAAPTELPRSIDQRVRSAMRFINDNLDMPLTAMTVAEYSHISYKQLNRLFREELGVTVLRYIHEQKSAKAKELLEDAELSLADVSASVGFENEYYFNAFFKKMNGTTPGAFRKSISHIAKK